MTGTRKSGRTRPWIYLLLIGALFAAGCSTSNENSGLNLVDAQGRHPAGWLAAFPGPSLHSRTATFAFTNDGTTNCTECHGGTLNGGIANVSCLNIACHHNPAVTDWANPTVHGAAAKKAPGSSSFFSCQICHGKGFDGGVSGVTCFDCHGDVHPHPEPPWLIVGATDNTHTNTDPSNAPTCAGCHFPGSPNNPPGFPATPAPAGTPPGCFNNTLCHAAVAGGANHAVPFVGDTHFQATQTTFNGNCANCHADAATSADASPPGCQVCHTAGSPLAVANCTSCHVSPPNGALPGAAYPNIAGAHAVHIGLNTPGNPAGTPISCDTCHNGLGTNTLNHYNRANARTGLDALRVPPGDVAFLATYNAESGASSFDNAALTCLNVSCHGGQTTPPWQTGTLDVNAVSGCTNCHAFGTAQFNSYSSGQHDQPIHAASGCLVCHNTTTLAVNHFTALSTAAMEGPASATIGGGSTLVTSYVAGATPGTGSCNALCHPGERGW